MNIREKRKYLRQYLALCGHATQPTLKTRIEKILEVNPDSIPGVEGVDATLAQLEEIEALEKELVPEDGLKVYHIEAVGEDDAFYAVVIDASEKEAIIRLGTFADQKRLKLDLVQIFAFPIAAGVQIGIQRIPYEPSTLLIPGRADE